MSLLKKVRKRSIHSLRGLLRKIIGWHLLEHQVKIAVEAGSEILNHKKSNELMFQYWEMRMDQVYATLVALEQAKISAVNLPAPTESTTAQCPVCTAPSRPWGRVKELPYWLCSGCQFLFADRTAVSGHFDLTINYYQTERYSLAEDAWPKNERIDLFSLLLKKGSEILPGAETFLDFGAGIKDLHEKAKLAPDFLFCDPGFQHELLIPLEDLTGKTFDLIILTEVIEHVEDQKALFATLRKLLKPTGICLATTLLHDDRFDLSYVNPEVGHISIHSKRSLNRIAISAHLLVATLPLDPDKQYYFHLLRPEKSSIARETEVAV